MRRRVPLRQSGWILFGVLVVVLGIEGIALGLRSSKLHTGGSQPAAVGALSTTTVTAMPLVQPVTTTTSPPPPVAAPGSLSYTLPANTRITVTATQYCWVEARTSANGRILFEDFLQPGQTKNWKSPVWIRFGISSAVDILAGSRPLVSPADSPGDLIIISS